MREFTNEQRLLLLNDLIETFEDFLEEKGIEIPNEEKNESDNPSNIYGTDYGILADELTAVLEDWSLIG